MGRDRFDNPAGGTTDRGAWAVGTAYVVGDYVTRGGGSWVAIASSTGVDPVTDGELTKWQPLAYNWEINHNAEDASGKTRNITRTAPTGAGGIRTGKLLIKQQADDGPLLLKFSGQILTRNQIRTMWRWYTLSSLQTIYFTDFDGNEFEVQITDFQPKRLRTLRNPRDPSMPSHYYEYSIQMEVYRVISGDWAGVTL